MSIKATTLNYFRENRLTRDICPGVRTEDWVLCSGFRYDVADFVVQIRPEYMTTATGQALLAKLHSAVARHAAPPALKKLDRLYRAEAQTNPERAAQIERIRRHIAQLERIPKFLRRTTPPSWVDRIVRAWCEERRLALHPNRQRSTEELERLFGQVQQELDSILPEVREVHGRARAVARRFRDLLAELRVRPECKIDASELRAFTALRELDPASLPTPRPPAPAPIFERGPQRRPRRIAGAGPLDGGRRFA